MTTLVISHAACLAYDTGEGHPEQPDRLRAIEGALESEVFQMLARTSRRGPRFRRSARPSARLHRRNSGWYAIAGHTAIDDDTSMSPGTFRPPFARQGVQHSQSTR